ncbi:uncharacterized protein Z519_05264 [Cladophialophora bantiana CBS 173.52]|uniref:Uncharacterized protein n=1 Tax=Cladophialophora bantiana (strain ATCC 10958 / CBS 173.52 / CDC B-1940 / NIH 8579) TaxID=1442370 RepID=A0A0D2IAX9_CLAB1|nr:uncharacterized protein Z519_05264 [Cladophialophora bantiana CBS 173.52]KIW93949.1 hypothetical protein Z519_05264 [Cladophialophora bantiana CBS 173.52]
MDPMTLERQWTEIYDLFRRNLLNYRRVKEAVLLLEQVAKIHEDSLAEDRTDRPTSQKAPPIAYEADGQSQTGTITNGEHVVKIEEQTLAEDHPSRLTCQQVRSTIYWDLVNYQAAI